MIPFASCPMRPFDYLLILTSLPELLQGALMTVQLVIIALAIGLLLTVPLALLRVSKNRWVWMPVYGYTYLFRGTPLLIQLFLIYYGLSQFDWIKETFLWTFFREPYWCALTAFTLNTTAYSTEILRGAIQNVPHGEVEAARACGMSKWLLYRRIVLPNAFRTVLPAYSNEVISMLQASAIASVVTLMDLTGVARVIVARTFAPYEIFITIAVMYLILTYAIDFAFRAVEHRLSGHLRDRPAAAPSAAVAAGVR
jgi:His/Glu/Gln/Arg/opine family amino acid ABC transporter permease subunit